MNYDVALLYKKNAKISYYLCFKNGKYRTSLTEAEKKEFLENLLSPEKLSTGNKIIDTSVLEQEGYSFIMTASAGSCNILDLKAFCDYLKDSTDYITVAQFAEKYDLSARMVTRYISEGRIEGAEKRGKLWYIPANAPAPIDGRTSAVKKSSKSVVEFEKERNKELELKNRERTDELHKELQATLESNQFDFHYISNFVRTGQFYEDYKHAISDYAYEYKLLSDEILTIEVTQEDRKADVLSRIMAYVNHITDFVEHVQAKFVVNLLEEMENAQNDRIKFLEKIFPDKMLLMDKAEHKTEIAGFNLVYYSLSEQYAEALRAADYIPIYFKDKIVNVVPYSQAVKINDPIKVHHIVWDEHMNKKLITVFPDEEEDEVEDGLDLNPWQLFDEDMPDDDGITEAINLLRLHTICKKKESS